MNDIVISTKKLTKSYTIFRSSWERIWKTFFKGGVKNQKEITALKQVNLSINRGEIVAILGSNGSGKTTLLEILTGTLSPSSGTVEINGQVSALLELGSGFNPEYTGRENVLLNGLLLGLSKQEILSRFDEIENFSEIGDAIDRPVKSYSSGMIMRLAFSVQVLCKPEILLVDEALSVGDFFFQQKCYNFLRELSQQGVTLVFVSHDMAMIRNLSKRAILINDGEIEFDGDTIKALQLFMERQSKTRLTEAKNSRFKIPAEPIAGRDYTMPNPIWVNKAIHQKTERARIFEVGIYDKNNKASKLFKIGEILRLIVSYESVYEKPTHVGLIIKNKYDQVVNVTTSYNLKLQPPTESYKNKLKFSADLTLNLEAGAYSIGVQLGLESEIFNQGENLFETPPLGPIDIIWNYGEEVAPFYGMVGLPAKGKFYPIVNEK